MLLESFALFYGILGSTATLKPHFDKLKSRLSVEATHEKIIRTCYRKALKDVTGEDLSRFHLKGDVAILQQIDNYFDNNDIRAASTYIGNFLSSLNIDLNAIQDRFEHHLSEAGSSEVLTYISLRMLDGTKRVERKLSEIADKLEGLMLPKTPHAPTGIPPVPTPYLAHPYPLQENFTGRLLERKELTEWFTKGAHPMFAYVAIGGMGKSALTWYWLQEDIIKQGLAPEGIIWWSFYDREARFETFLEKAIQYVGKGKIDVKKIDSTRDRMDTLYILLCNSQFLIVLDGVERVLRAYAGLGSPYQGDEVKEDEMQDFRVCIDPNVSIFLQRLASRSMKTKTLITSRLYPKDLDGIEGCLHVELKEMKKVDAVDFFHRQGVRGRRDEIERACEPFGYHPLSLRLLSGMIVKDPKYMGDVIAWTKYNPLTELKGKEKHHILELAYNSLDQPKQTLISKLSAFRNPMGYDTIAIFNEFKSQKKFDDSLIELVDRGLLFNIAQTNKYDLHPIVRKYCYDKLKDKGKVHSQVRNYFASVPEPEKVESLDDLAAVIELYHHTVRSEKYEAAFQLYEDRLDPLYYQFGAYSLIIDLMKALFSDGEDKPPRLQRKTIQAWVLNELANSYSLSGQARKAVPLYEKMNDIYENMMSNNKYLAISLGNFALDQIRLGDFESAELNLRRRINLCEIIDDEFREAVGHLEFGRLLSYQGNFQESENELSRSFEVFAKDQQIKYQSIVWAYRSISALFMSDVEKALRSAKRAREQADAMHYERDIIRAEWLLGASYLAKGYLNEAELHLNEALMRDRRINLVEIEPDILLELAKLRFKQGHKEEALKLANDALGIADRCEYRLKQADIHNFLAEFYLDAKDITKAKEHVEKAEERAECGYVPAMKKAEELSKRISQQIKQMKRSTD